uniref:Uncharacterized protein n=1 Tax=Anaerobacillus isosaccharinicus TaxID=1532552 RepID=A0A1S2MFZ1_9BACI
MLPQIITYLLTFINYQEQVIRTLLTLLIGKSMFDVVTSNYNLFTYLYKLPRTSNSNAPYPFNREEHV